MNVNRHSRASAGYTLIEILTTVAIIALLTTGMVVGAKPTWSGVDDQWGPKTAASLNLAMDTYRALQRRGFAPSSSWSATTAQGVLAELAKPMLREGVQVIVMHDAPLVNLSVGNITPSNFTSTAVWSSNP